MVCKAKLSSIVVSAGVYYDTGAVDRTVKMLEVKASPSPSSV